MPAARLHDLWFDNFVRSSLRCDVAFSSSFLQKRCVYLQLYIKGASIRCREKGYVSTVSWQELRGPSSPPNRLGIGT
jgi:hypothetical protein